MRGSALVVGIIVLVAFLVVGGAVVLLLADDGDPRPPAPVVDDGGKVAAKPPDTGSTEIEVPDTPFPRPADGGPPFVPEGSEDLLARVDFEVMGEHVAVAARLLGRFAASVSKEEDPGEETVNGFKEAQDTLHDHLRGLEPELGDDAPWGVYCHPLIVANTLDATLTKVGRPLTDAQMHRVAILLDEAWASDRERRAAGRPSFRDEWFAARLLREAAPRQAFYDAVLPVLSKGQRDQLRPLAARGRVGLDMFSTGQMWAPMAQFVPFLRDETEFSIMLTDQIGPKVGFPPRDQEHHEAMRAAVLAWRQSLPEDFPRRQASLLDTRNHFEIRLAPVYARETLRLLEMVLDAGPPEYAMRYRIAPILFAVIPDGV